MANKQLNTAKAKDTVKNCSEEAVCKGHKVPLDLNSCDYCKFQVTCTLGYFGFFCSEELTFTNMASFYTVQTLLTYLSLQENVCWPLTIVLT